MELFQSKAKNYQVNSSSLSIGHVNLLESLDIFEWVNIISEKLEPFLKKHYFNLAVLLQVISIQTPIRKVPVHQKHLSIWEKNMDYRV